MQKIIKFIMENKLFILQLTFLGIIAMNQTAFASDFAMKRFMVKPSTTTRRRTSR